MTRRSDRGGRGHTVTSPSDVSRDGATPPISDRTLPNGVRVLSERIPGVRSAAVGVWIRHGSAHEAPERMGESHMLEHMVFKGTERRSAREIALSLEALGGSLDAFTSREHTSFQARVLDANLPEALDVLSDMVRRPALRSSDLVLEREVVLEEIAQVEDTPDDRVFELHGSRLWQGHPYGHAILGTRDTVSALSIDDLRDVHESHYRGRHLVVAAAGNVDHDRFLELVQHHLGDAAEGDPPRPAPASPSAAEGRVHVERDTAQAHLVVGTTTVPHAHRLRVPLILVSLAFGGGMSSRLFQRIREELGLAYTVFSFQSFYARAGLAGVYLGTRAGGAGRAEDALREEYARLAADGLGADELEQTRRQLKGQIMLSLESTSNRLYRLAGSALHGEPWLDLDALLARVDAVTADDVREAARLGYDPGAQFTLHLGPDGSA
ncbi:MAG: insulinase family protein [Gemmatimonadetes bacterium]|nr:insulinase family protein [Gemmatimonadota bacterium]